MASLVVGGVTIPVAISSPAWSRSDAVDRGRMFDGTFFASESGGASRDWTFSTPPVTQSDADIYIAALSSPAAKLCSGDIIQIPTMCSPELPSGKPTRAASSNLVVLDFMLHEIQPARVLLRYAPGDTITGESFARSTTANQYSLAGVVTSAAINAKRDSHYLSAVRSTLLERARTNGWTRSEELNDAAWTKFGATITANVVVAPDGATTADVIVESALNEAHVIERTFAGATNNTLQTVSFFAKPNTRTFVRIATYDKAATLKQSWVNVSTGAAGTVASGHTVRITALGGGWYRVAVTFDATSGGSTPTVDIGPSTADAVVGYLGNGTDGIACWGLMVEVDQAFPSAYIPTAASTVTRNSDSYSLPFTTPPQEMTLYAKFVESGNILSTTSGGILEIADAAGAASRILLYAPSAVGFYRILHENASSSVTSTLASAPVFGDVVELVAQLFGDGSVQLTQSINGGAATSSTQSAALSFASAWSGQLCWLNPRALGFVAIQSFKIVAGARSLVEMRAA